MNTTLVAAAGEYFVAHKLSRLEYMAAPVRAGSPAADVLACRPDGGKTIAIQVKTSRWAERTKGRGNAKAVVRLEFTLGVKAVEEAPKDLIFCFVDLRIPPGAEGPARAEESRGAPVIYVIPAMALKRRYAGTDIRQYKWFRLHQSVKWMDQFRNNWNPVIRALS